MNSDMKQSFNCVDRFLGGYQTMVEAALALERHTGRKCSKQRIDAWKKAGYIPWTFALAVEQITKHKITLHEIIGEATRTLKG